MNPYDDGTGTGHVTRHGDGHGRDDAPDDRSTRSAYRRGDEPGHTGGSGDDAAKAALIRKTRRRDVVIASVAVVVMLSGLGLAAAAYYVDGVPTPDQLELPQSTTVYFADAKTPMAKLGTENRTILQFDEMIDSIKEAIVAAEDQTFWTNEGVDFSSVLRAAWNNFTGGRTQGASTITQQYARIAADLKGVTYSRKLREAVMAWKLDDKYSKEEILGYYLNTVPFGRGAYGIEAAAQAFFGKTANKNASPARQLTVAEAMVLVSMVKQPEPNPNDPEGQPGYDPTRGPTALENSRSRWNYVRDGMVSLGYLTRAEADSLEYPNTVQEFDPSSRQSGLDLPTGLTVHHVLSELQQTAVFRGKPKGYLQNGGFRIVTTIDQRAQAAAEAAADITRRTAPSVVRGQPKNWRAALVAVEPGSGRVLAYYGGNDGAGADYAGWYYDEDGGARGFGQHPPGSSFKVYDLAEAIRQQISVKSRWDSPATKEFPASGRTKGSAAGPVRNASSAECQPRCTLWEATVASLNVTYFALTEKLGPANVIDMARKSGVDSMWTTVKGQAGSGTDRHAGEDRPGARGDLLHRGRHRSVRDYCDGPRQRDGDLRGRWQEGGGTLCPFGDEGRRRGLHGEARADRHRARQGADQRVELDAEQGADGQAVEQLGRRRKDRHLAVGQFDHQECAHVDGRVHEGSCRGCLGRHDRRRGAENEDRRLQRLRCELPWADLAAVHGGGHGGDEARPQHDQIRPTYVRRRVAGRRAVARAPGAVAVAHEGGAIAVLSGLWVRGTHAQSQTVPQSHAGPEFQSRWGTSTDADLARCRPELAVPEQVAQPTLRRSEKVAPGLDDVELVPRRPTHAPLAQFDYGGAR